MAKKAKEYDFSNNKLAVSPFAGGISAFMDAFIQVLAGGCKGMSVEEKGDEIHKVMVPLAKERNRTYHKKLDEEKKAKRAAKKISKATTERYDDTEKQ